MEEEEEKEEVERRGHEELNRGFGASSRVRAGEI